MKIRADEHVSPEIVRAVGKLCLSAGWEFTSVLDVGHGGKEDDHWITLFAREGGKVIITADRDFVSLEPQVNAVFDTGMRVILMPSKWSQSKGNLQAAHILLWWPRIEKVCGSMRERECFKPSWNLKDDGDLTKVTIDFQKAQRKRRHDNKRAE